MHTKQHRFTAVSRTFQLWSNFKVSKHLKMDYGLMKINTLKRDLKNRGAKVTGTKEKLIERLKDYDRNNNFNISANLAKQIQIETKGQVKNKLWHSERALRVTASKAGEICKFTEKRDQLKYAQNLACPKNIVNTALEWGKAKERTAIESYEVKTKQKVESCGLFISEQCPFIGASPDGLIGQDTVLEVKCPFSIKNECIAPENYPHVEYSLEGSLRLKESSNYYYQIQTQMFVTNRSFCEFFIWTNVDEK